MAANIENNNGRASFFTVREPAWHNLGKVVQEAPTSEEAIKLAGLDFEVIKQPMFTYNENNIPAVETYNKKDIIKLEDKVIQNKTTYKFKQGLSVPDKYAIVRKDNSKVFGVVGSRYEIVQNSQAFDFFDDIVGSKEAIFETAGALYNGEVIFITAKLPSYIKVRDKDQIDKYLLFTMSHDGTSSIKVIFTPIRVVCWNTLSAAINKAQAKDTFVFRHTKSVHNKLEIASKIMGVTNQLSDELTDIFNSMTKVKLKDEETMAYLEASLGLTRNEEGNLSTRAQNILNDAMDYYVSGAGQQADYVAGTVYGAYNAYTGYLSNVKNYKTEEDRMQSVMLDTDKTKYGFELALSLGNLN